MVHAFGRIGPGTIREKVIAGGVSIGKVDGSATLSFRHQQHARWQVS